MQQKVVGQSNRRRLLVFGHEHFRLRFHPAQCFPESHCLRFFAVDDENLLDVAGQSVDVAPQFIFVRVAGKGVD